MPAASRKTTRRAPAKRVPLRPAAFEPVEIVTEPDAEPEPVEQVVLFTLDGVEYLAPTRLPLGVSLRLIRTSRQRGDDAAMAEMLEEVIGTRAYLALSRHPGLKQKHLTDIFRAVRMIAMGAVEAPKGSSASA